MDGMLQDLRHKGKRGETAQVLLTGFHQTAALLTAGNVIRKDFFCKSEGDTWILLIDIQAIIDKI